MTATATLSPTDVATLARFFRVLADPTRLRVIELLAEGPRNVGELVEALGAPQSRVSTHLACLRHCRVVSTERRGTQVVYTLALADAAALIARARDVAAPEAEHLASCSRVGPEWI